MAHIIKPEKRRLALADILRKHIADYQGHYRLFSQHRKIVFDLHCLVAGGAVSKDGSFWASIKGNYLFNQQALSLVLRGKFIDQMSRACQREDLKFAGDQYKKLKARLYEKKWIIDVRDPVKKPEQVLEYLARYTPRVAIANSRIKALKDAMVTFNIKNRKKNRTEQPHHNRR